MKMLMIVARGSMEDELLDILKRNDVHAYTVIQKVEGAGETGTVLNSFFWPGYNLILLVVPPSDRLDGVIDALKAHHARRMKDGHGQPVPFRLFSLPCEELI